MTIGGLLFLVFIGLPILGFLIRTLVMLVVFPFFAAGAGAKAVKENRADKRQAAIDAEMKRLDDAERARSAQRRSA